MSESTSTHSFLAADGKPVYYYHLRAKEIKSGTVAVLIIHGMGEYAMRYEPIAKILSRHGYDVFMADLRGFGKSPISDMPVHFETHLSDCRDLVECIRKRWNLPQSFLLGHSYGGFISMMLGYELAGLGIVRGIILSSPFLGLNRPVSQVQAIALKNIARIRPSTIISTGIEPQQLTDDPDILRAYKGDKSIRQKVSAGLMASIFDAQDQLRSNPRKDAQLGMPLHLMQAENENIVSVRDYNDFFSHQTNPCNEHTYYKSAHHEILHGLHQTEAIGNLLPWMTKTLKCA